MIEIWIESWAWLHFFEDCEKCLLALLWSNGLLTTISVSLSIHYELRGLTKKKVTLDLERSESQWMW